MPLPDSPFATRLFDEFPDGLVVIRFDGAMVFSNREIERMFDYGRDELFGQSIDLLVPQRFWTVLSKHRRECFGLTHLRTMPFPANICGMKKNGNEFPIDARMSVVEIDNEFFGVNIIREVSGSNRVADEIRMLSSIVEFSEDAIVAETSDGTILSWNASAERTFGYSYGEAIGRPITILAPAGLEQEPLDILRRIKMGERIEHYETVRRRKDGESVDVSLSVSPIRNVTGDVISASMIARDVTQHKRLQDELHKMMERRTQDLQEYANSVQRAQEDERQRIARELHDELGQRLMGAKLTLDVLEDAIAKKNVKAIAMLESAKEQIRSTIAEVRRISSGLRPTALDEFGLVVALQLLCKEFEKTHALKIDFDADLGNDYSREIEIAVYRITQEALLNAAKHAKSASARVRVCQENQTILLSIADTGKGFDETALLKQGGARKGLGLITMRERSQLVGGTFHIDSKDGEGTRIVVRFPLTRTVQ